MTDIKRSKNMAAVKNKDTKPELLIRKLLFKEGFRYRLNKKELPGKPDIFLPRFKTVIFVHGCFWHMHNCPAGKTPSSNKDFWLPKLKSNVTRDEKNYQKLMEQGFRIIIIWECALKGKNKLDIRDLKNILIEKIENEEEIFSEIKSF